MNNHHASTCHFLQKLKQCLAYMESNNLTPSDNRRGMRNNADYPQRSRVIRTLVDENFIPYDDVDPDMFINVAEAYDCFEPENSEDGTQS